MNEDHFTAAPICDLPTLKKKVRALAEANRLIEYTALRYAQRLEVGQELDVDGKAIVRDDQGRELARVIVPKNVERLSDEPLHEGLRRLIVDAEIVTRDGRLLPVVWPYGHTEGLPFCIETEAAWLDLGFAAMQPLREDFTADDSAPVNFQALLPADPEAGRLNLSHLQNFTDHPNVVAVSRRFHVLNTYGEAKEGPLKINDRDRGQ